MSKIRDLRLYKRFLAILTAITLIPASLGALAENATEEVTDDVRIEEMVDEQEVQQITLEEFVAITNDLYNEFRPLYRDVVFGLSNFQSGYYAINHESCENIYDDLKEMGVVIFENGKPLRDSIYKSTFILPYYIKNLTKLKNNDFSKICYRETDREFLKPYMSDLASFSEALSNKKSVKKENIKKIIEFLDKIESENSSCLKMYAEMYIATIGNPLVAYIMKKPEKERLKYFVNAICPVLKDNVVLDENSDNELELLIILNEKIKALDEEVYLVDVVEYDKEHTKEHVKDM